MGLVCDMTGETFVTLAPAIATDAADIDEFESSSRDCCVDCGAKGVGAIDPFGDVNAS